MNEININEILDKDSNDPLIVIDAPYHSEPESIKEANNKVAEFAKRFCEEHSDLLKRLANR